MNKHVNERKIRRKAAEPKSTRVINHFRRLQEYNHRCEQAMAAEGLGAMRRYMHQNPYYSRGHSKATRFSSRAALTKASTGKVYPHDSKREAARHVMPKWMGWHFGPFGEQHHHAKYARRAWAQDAVTAQMGAVK